MRVYIAGPIAGHPNGNAAAFAYASDALAERGYDPVNPHALGPHNHAGDCPAGPPAGQTASGQEAAHTAPCYMRADLAALLTCDAIYLLEGWETSKGATAELLAAQAAGLQILFQPTWAGLRQLQRVVQEWQARNFGPSDEFTAFVGLIEEVGEVCQAAVKRSQGIRGTREEWDARLYEELGDVVIKLIDVCRGEGIDLADTIMARWDTIQARDWVADPVGHGMGGES